MKQKWTRCDAPSPAVTTSDAPPAYNKEPSILETVGNRIYFYANMERENVLKLNREIKILDNSFVAEKINRELDEYPKIFIHINTFGGCIFSGFSAMDNVSACKSPVHTIVDGVCASAGTFMYIAGKKRFITKHSYILIHQISSCFWGKYQEFKDEMDNLDTFMKMLKNIYLERTKIPEKRLEEMLKKDIFFDAKQCVKYGIADEII